MIDELLSTEVDKTGSEVKIISTSQIGMSPLCGIYLKSYSELIEAGHAWPRMNGTNKTKAIYATIDNKIVGHIAYELLTDWLVVHIIFSRVDPNFRKRGIYKMMFSQLETMSKAAKYRRIVSEIHIDNLGIIASHEAVGMRTTFLKNEKDI
jgi:ribosomal protein S18 acetylase RimI-like enzyme